MTVESLFLSWVITWTVGLVPPYVIRKVIAKAPIRKVWAFTISLCLYCGNVILFEAMGATSRPHVALVIIAFLSVKILRSSNPFELGADDFAKNKEAISESVASKMVSDAVRLEASGAMSEAIKAYTEIIKRFPDSSSAVIASDAINALNKNLPNT